MSVSQQRACQVLGQTRSTQRRVRNSPDDEVWTLRLPQDHIFVSERRLEGQSQMCREDLMTGSIKSASKTTLNEALYGLRSGCNKYRHHAFFRGSVAAPRSL
jgi:hypothetical protein